MLATDERFKRHELPPFFNKRFTSTGLTSTVKKDIKNLIEANGGTYSGSFSSRNIDILILEMSNIGSDKHRAAESTNVESLTPDWIRDSAKKGYALPVDPYKVVSANRAPSHSSTLLHSTPSKDENPGFLSDSSVVSRIGAEMTINETLMSNVSVSTPDSAKGGRPYKEALNKLNIQAAKKAELFLDGCNVSQYNSFGFSVYSFLAL